MNLSQYVDEVSRIARLAGREILRIYERDFEVSYKADQSPLTEADKAAHALIASKLFQLNASIPILSEEDVDAFAGPNNQGLYWLVDPLDGTKEFVKRNGEFTVNIALIQHGEPVLGVVYAPVLDELYYASRDNGAFKVSGSSRPIGIHVAQRLDGQPCKVVGSRSHAGPETEAWLSQLGEYEVVPMGSSLKLCLVAEGKAHVYPRLGPTSLWDTAAAHAVVLEAGGQVMDLEGKPLGYSKTDQLLNPFFIVAAENFFIKKP